MKLTWDDAGTRLYETGVSQAALYPENGSPVAWNGLIAVTASPSGGEPSPIYANNVKIADSFSFQDYDGSIESFTYPNALLQCDGSAFPVPGLRIAMQKRRRFGLAYKTLIGNDTRDLKYGYKLHIHYGCIVRPLQKDYKTITENPDLLHFKWDFTSIPVRSSGFPPLSYLCIVSSKVSSAAMQALDDILFGTEQTDPTLPFPDEVAAVLQNN